MAVTDDANLAERMRIMSLHGLSRDAWLRYSGGGWDYSIVAPGFKYNLTDIAASIGLHQLARAEELRRAREAITRRYFDALADVEEIELPAEDSNRMHSWHLFAIRLNIESLAIDRDQFIRELDARGIGSSVHWRPLHLHSYYREKYSWRASDFPVATREWRRLVSLPLYPTMSDRDVDAVTDAVRAICVANVRKRVFANSIGKGANSHSR